MASQQPDMVSCTINGAQVTVPKGTRIIEAAELVGIGVAHYCYHPGLSAPAMCRMCLVEVEGAPKLAPACVTAVADGQVIHTESGRAREAREGLLEFYLLNHPLDCPVCDKSGECKLQDFVHQEGRSRGRSLEGKRILGRDDFGGDILYDGDRCILCTRCVRFMREVAGEDRLCVVQRGHRSVIDTFYDQGLESSNWAGNVVDICPVGALLSKDFLHKARVWDLDGQPSICPNCSQGCNVRIDTRDNLVMRVRPRENADVNAYWMCDYGRYRYEWFNRSDRLATPGMRDGDGELQPVGWQDAVRFAVDRLTSLRGRAAALLASPFLANEDAGLLARLGAVLGGTAGSYRSAMAADEEPCPGFPTLARRRELAANGRGLEVLGFRRVGAEDGRGGLQDVRAAGALVVVGDDLADAPADFGRDADFFLYIGDVAADAARNAHVVLPATLFAEQDGTFTNHEGRVQRFWPALQPPPLARPAWQILGVLLAGLGDGRAPATAADALQLVGHHFEAFAGLDYAVLGTRGALLNEPVTMRGGGGP
jgi:NADH-quinone oxidoreductase subunit G